MKRLSEVLHSSKRLVVALAALFASIVLCIGVCLAWFSSNRQVNVNNTKSEFDAGDIKKFEVTAYYLNASGQAFLKASTGNVLGVLNEEINVDLNSDGILNEFGNGENVRQDEMRPYTTLTNSYATAVLFEIKYKIRLSDDKSYKIYASCPTDSVLAVSLGSNMAYNSPLSNSVAISTAAVSDPDAAEADKTYSAQDQSSGGIKSSFVDNTSNYDKIYKVDYITGIMPNVPSTEDPNFYEGTSYLIMDYDPELFAYLSTKMLEEGASLDSRLFFGGDISIGIEVEKDITAVPESIELINGDTNARTSQTASLVDVISPTWLFNVKYSDGSVRTVSNGSNGLTVDINTVRAGENKTANITYTERNTTVSTSVTYTIIAGGHIHDYVLTAISAPTADRTGSATLTCGETGCPNPTVTMPLPKLTDSAYTVTAGSNSTRSRYTIVRNGIEISFEGDKLVNVTGVTLNHTAIEIYVGDTETLVPTIAPANATNKGVDWSTSANTIVTVNSNGLITGINPGVAIVTVTTKDGRKTATCTVTVKPVTINVTGVSLDRTTLNLATGGTAKLTATVVPSNATDRSVTWTTSDSSVATVSSNGTVTAAGVGTATITVTTTDGSFTATCRVNVSASEYTVTFNANSHGTAPAAQTTTDGKLSSLPTMSVTGYDFGGWYENAACTGSAVTTSKTYTANTTLYAKWTIQSFAVTFDTDGGSAVASQTVNYGDTATRPADPTKEGYVFDDWYTSASGTTVYDFTTPISRATTIYAHWASSQVTLSFHSVGGTDVAARTVAKGGTVTRPANPTKTGYTFDDWYTTPGGNTKYNFSSALNADTTVYARWLVSGDTVYTYNYGGTNVGTWAATSTGTQSSQDTPAVSGLEILGSSSNSKLTLTASGNKATVYLSGFTIGSNNPQDYVTVTFYDGDDVSVGTLTGTTPTGKRYADYTFTNGGVIETARPFTKVVFTCGNSGKSYCVINLNVKVETVAASEYTVSFNANGHGTNPAAQTTTDGKLSSLPTMSVTGYTFGGWYENEDCTGSAVTTSKTYTANTTLYAKWTAVSYTITYNLDGGANHADNPASYTIESAAITLKAPSKSGYTFGGWYENASFTGTAVTTIAAGSTGNKTFYAKWTEEVERSEYRYAASGSTAKEYIGDNGEFTEYSLGMFSLVTTETGKAAPSVSGGKFSFGAGASTIRITLEVTAGETITVSLGNVRSDTAGNGMIAYISSGASNITSGNTGRTTVATTTAASTNYDGEISYTIGTSGTIAIDLQRFSADETSASDGKGHGITLETVTVSGGRASAHTHTFATEWSSDATNHWHAATCGHTVTSGSAAHTLGYASNGTQHWQVCTVCGYETAKTNHTLSYSDNATQHWQECSVCGYEGTKANHDYDDDSDTTCNTCGHVRTISGGGSAVMTKFEDSGVNDINGKTITNNLITISGSGGSYPLTTVGGGGTATASDGKTFTKAYYSSDSGRSISVEAKENVTIKIYYTASSSTNFTSNTANSKKGNLKWTIGGTTYTSENTSSKTNNVAYVEEITLTAGQTCTFTISTNRLAVFGIEATPSA